MFVRCRAPTLGVIRVTQRGFYLEGKIVAADSSLFLGREPTLTILQSETLTVDPFPTLYDCRGKIFLY